MNLSVEHRPFNRSDEYEAKKRALLKDLSATDGLIAGLNRASSNLFRHRVESRQKKINLSHFDEVISLDPVRQVVEVEGMTRYETLVATLLPLGFMPAVVPELKTITIGGAVTGVGIESSSFRYGLVHESVTKLEILTAQNEVVECTPTSEHKALFFGFPNSYGTLGYALKVELKVHPVSPYVYLKYRHFSDYGQFFKAIEDLCQDTAPHQFIDGVVFSNNHMVLCQGRFSNTAPYTSDYTYKHIFYKSVAEREEDYLTASDYIWRWDTDWFWCSRYFFMEQPLVRRFMGKKKLNSEQYWQLRAFFAKYKVPQLLQKLSNKPKEPVIQDVEIPIEKAAGFMRFFDAQIGIRPVWICPTRASAQSDQFVLYDMKPGCLYVNFGFWDFVAAKTSPTYHNRMIEDKVSALKGKKSLYSDVCYPRDTFWKLYHQDAYKKLKTQYDPKNRFKNLYEKCVLKH